MEFTLRFIHVFFLELYYAAPVLVSLMMLITIIGYVIGKKEGWSRLDAFYHAFINATTVGYGDISPSSEAGRWSTVILIYFGGIFALAKGAGDYFDYRAARRRLQARGLSGGTSACCKARLGALIAPRRPIAASALPASYRNP